MIGGLLIGLAAVILMAGPGRAMGASGIFAGLLSLNLSTDTIWRAVFILGMLLGALIAQWVGLFDPAVFFFTETPTLIIAGILVGFGTRLGSGCTSGHGICGLARLSPRSLVATSVFMGVAFATTFISRHLIGG